MKGYSKRDKKSFLNVTYLDILKPDVFLFRVFLMFNNSINAPLPPQLVPPRSSSPTMRIFTSPSLIIIATQSN